MVGSQWMVAIHIYTIINDFTLKIKLKKTFNKMGTPCLSIPLPQPKTMPHYQTGFL